MAYIYCITNRIDGKRYVGQTATTLSRRWNGHKQSAKRHTNDSHLARAIRLHGHDAFMIEPLQECQIDELDELERWWIAQLRTQDPNVGYNLSPGGLGGNRGLRRSDDARAKMRARHWARDAKRRDQATRRNSESHVGIEMDHETRAKISRSLAGHVRSETTRTRIGETKKGSSNPMWGKPSKRRPVVQCTPGWQLIAVHGSIEAAAKAANVSAPTIRSACARAVITAGSRWCFLEDDPV